MGHRIRSRGLGVGALVICLALIGAACSESQENSPDDSQAASRGDQPNTRLVGSPATDVDPVDGGTISVGTFSEVSAVDPVIAHSSGTAGGIELAAVYDVLMRYNPETREYEPQLAKSLEADDDHSTWTLTLRDGVEFTDGTPLDAQAVKFSVERYIEKRAFFAGVLGGMLQSISVDGPTTVTFHLADSWPDFPYMLATGPGNIVSPTAVKKWGDDYVKHPTGAGAFTVQKLVPGDELVMKANPGYWSGKPHLDGLRFVNLGGADITDESLESGGIQVGFIRDAKVAQELLDADKTGYLSWQNVGKMVLINNASGHPGDDVRVRQAIAHAIDPEFMNKRVEEGYGLVSSALFADGSPWHDDEVGGPAHDPEKAKQLLEEAKADGYDGKIGYTCYVTGQGKDEALAVQAQLESVGFEVETDLARTVGDYIKKVVVDRDYDTGCYGINVSDEAPWVVLSNSFSEGSAQNITDFSSTEMPALLDQLQVAESDEDKASAIDAIQEQWNEEVPSVVWGATPELLAWDDSVHGIVPTAWSVILFDKAFVTQ